MPAQNHFRNELNTMCSLSYVIEERGIEKGIKQERLNIVKNMLLQHMPVEDIKKHSGATAEEILEVKESLYAKQKLIYLSIILIYKFTIYMYNYT